MPHEKAVIPEDLLQLSQRFEAWRSAQPPRSRLPESMWAAAAEMAQRHGVHCTTKALRLDYTRFEEALAGSSLDRADAIGTAGFPGTVDVIGKQCSGMCGGGGVQP